MPIHYFLDPRQESCTILLVAARNDAGSQCAGRRWLSYRPVRPNGFFMRHVAKEYRDIFPYALTSIGGLKIWKVGWRQLPAGARPEGNGSGGTGSGGDSCGSAGQPLNALIRPGSPYGKSAHRFLPINFRTLHEAPLSSHRRFLQTSRPLGIPVFSTDELDYLPRDDLTWFVSRSSTTSRGK